jgi:hypothetical protein
LAAHITILEKEWTVFLEIRIAGHLDQHWSEWFEGLEMQHLPDGSTQLSGSVIDQTALYGLLSRARDLGMTLLTVAVESTEPEEANKTKGSQVTNTDSGEEVAE